MIMKLKTPQNIMLIYMCAKFGSRSFKIATENVRHRISVKIYTGRGHGFRLKNGKSKVQIVLILIFKSSTLLHFNKWLPYSYF